MSNVTHKLFLCCKSDYIGEKFLFPLISTAFTRPFRHDFFQQISESHPAFPTLPFFLHHKSFVTSRDCFPSWKSWQILPDKKAAPRQPYEFIFTFFVAARSCQHYNIFVEPLLSHKIDWYRFGNTSVEISFAVYFNNPGNQWHGSVTVSTGEISSGMIR